MRYISLILISLASLMVYADTPDTRAVQPGQMAARPTAGEQIKWQVVAGGGGTGTSTNYIINSTVGQTATGTGTSTNYKINQGYWQNFSAATGCCVKGGDANNDTKVNVGDAVYMINYVFKAGPAPVCKDQGDANHDCRLNVGDAVYLINYVFKSGPVPQCGCVGP